MTRAAVIAVLLIVLAGCSNGESTDSATSPPASPTPSPIASPTATVPEINCSQNLLVTARGTTESLDSDSSLLIPLAEQIAQAQPQQTSIIDLPYPATAENLHTGPNGADFGESANQGVDLLVRLLNQAATECPDQRTVLMGYSQGALVVGDSLLAPTQRRAGRTSIPLTPSATTHVAAVVLYGDPRFVGTDPFNVGTYDSNRNGFSGPRNPGELESIVQRMRSFCVADDFVCQEGGRFEPHVSYYNNGMRADGAAFVLSKLKG